MGIAFSHGGVRRAGHPASLPPSPGMNSQGGGGGTVQQKQMHEQWEIRGMLWIFFNVFVAPAVVAVFCFETLSTALTSPRPMNGGI